MNDKYLFIGKTLRCFNVLQFLTHGDDPFSFFPFSLGRTVVRFHDFLLLRLQQWFWCWLLFATWARFFFVSARDLSLHDRFGRM